MKKILVLALAIVMALSVVALVACAKEESYEGEYHYNSYGHEYGCKVKVTVKGDVIMKVAFLDSDYVRTSADNADLGWTSYQKTEDAYPDYLASFKGKTVKEVMDYTVSISGQNNATENSVPEAAKLTGATQSAARIILAIQNALGKIETAK